MNLMSVNLNKTTIRECKKLKDSPKPRFVFEFKLSLNFCSFLVLLLMLIKSKFPLWNRKKKHHPILDSILPKKTHFSRFVTIVEPVWHQVKIPFYFLLADAFLVMEKIFLQLASDSFACHLGFFLTCHKNCFFFDEKEKKRNNCWLFSSNWHQRCS